MTDPILYSAPYSFGQHRLSRPGAAPGFTVVGKTALPIFNALQRAALSARTKGLTCRGWQILFGSSCSVWSCSAASIVGPLHHRPIAVGKSAAHLVYSPAALVACPCDPVMGTSGRPRLSLSRTRLVSVQFISLDTKIINLRQHPSDQRFGRCGRDSCSLELKDFLPLA